MLRRSFTALTLAAVAIIGTHASPFMKSAFGQSLPPCTATSGPDASATTALHLDVRDAPYGAKGDGVTDDTAAIQRALDDAAVTATVNAEATVFVPAGVYLVSTHLSVPSFVTLMGTFRAPADWQGGFAPFGGSLLRAVAEAGNADGTPFITLATHATLRGISVFYPNQTTTAAPTAYPWAVRGSGPNVTILDVMLVNPYRGVDLASATSDNHFISGLYGQALQLGLAIDHCASGGHVQDVHFFPFWQISGSTPARQFQGASGVGILVEHADGEVMKNIFAISYSVGMRFASSPSNACVGLTCGTSSGQISNLNFDTTGVSLDVYATSAAGWQIDGMNSVNDIGTFEFPIWHHPGAIANLDISDAASWGAPQEIALWQGDGELSLSGSLITQWNSAKSAIDVRAGTVTVEGNMFANDAGTAISVTATGHANATGNQMSGDTMSGSVTSVGNSL